MGECNARIPAEVFPPGVFIADELEARGWSVEDLARRMPGDYGENFLCIGLLLAVHDKNLMMGEDIAEKLADAFGVSPQYFINLDRTWRLGRYPI